jgi:chromosome segregation protein
MRLIKLTLSGFKSFADTTEFAFERPVTGVVGPNGCGKSNVVDAIKWVLGERSSKSLRGTEMLDVIFAGSAARKPVGLASVKLTFENPVLAVARASTPRTQSGIDALVDGTNPAPADPADATSSESDGPTNSSGGPLNSTTPATPARPHRELPIDADVVEIERRLYRDGGSEYLINGEQARLKDIRELFLDTGVGADAYSIIEQGKVDAMLLASPQERRVIFEEAAGIAKYKQRRVEAQRRLERATTNLKGAKEQLESTERRLRLVKGQAAKARRFVELDAELKAWREALTLDQYDDLCNRIDGLTSRQAQASAQRDESHARVAHLEESRQHAELARHERGESHKKLEQELLSAQHARSQAEQRRAMLERLIDQARADAAADRAALTQLRERAGTTDAAIADAREQVGALAERWQEGERRLQAAATDRAALLEALGEAQRSHAQRSGDAARVERERASMLGAIEGESTRAAALREQLERIHASQAGLSAQRTQNQTDRDATSESQRAAQAAQAELEQSVQSLEALLADLGADRQARASEVAKLDQELARVEGRRTTLQETMQARVGFAEAVRRALDLRAKGEGFARVVAPLADLVQTRSGELGLDVDATIAVELALGQDLQALVAPTHADIAAPEELARVGGRVAFLVLARAEPARETDPIADPTANDAGDSLQPPISDDARATLVRMRSLVHARPGEHAPAIDSLLDRLLGRTYLVESLDAALLLEAGPLPGARFVTRRGEILERGRVIAGPTGLLEAESKSAGAGSLLRRQGELESLAKRSDELAAALLALREALAGVDAEAGQLTQRVGDARKQLALAQRAALAEQSKLERLTHDLARHEREERTLEQERTRLSERIESAERDVAQRKDKALSLARLAEELSAAALALSEDLALQRASADSAGERVTSAKVEVGTLSEQLSGARRELARQEAAKDELERRTADLASRVEGQESRVQEHEAAIAHALDVVRESIAKGDALGADLAHAREALEAAQAASDEIAKALHAARNHATVVERDFHSLEVSRRELEVKRETMEERALQDFSLPLATALPEYRALLAPAATEDGEPLLLLRPDHALAQTAIDDLKDTIKRLGNVNMDALQEETTLEGQNESLVRQVADIESARDQLTQLIEQLNVASKQRFEGIFSTIQQQFGGEQGMFRKLFGGGRAEVRLMPLVREVEQPDGSFAKVETNEFDVLESGIEVIAKPPGKEPRAISQLSGGEKTLTAVALLLSIFRSKPSCFCVLDEVDAALDEGNVGRFNAAIRDFTDKSSFIVITHNKRTMQNADHLYGVTMQERGVSTRVSVRFEQVGKDGKIEVKAEVKAEVSAQPHAQVGAGATVAEHAPASSPDSPSNTPGAPSPQVEPKPARRRRERPAQAALAVATLEAPPDATPAPAALPLAPSAASRPAIADAPGDGVVTVVAREQSPEPLAPAVHVAPIGIGDQPHQQTTLGMSPLKRAMQRLREASGE